MAPHAAIAKQRPRTRAARAPSRASRSADDGGGPRRQRRRSLDYVARLEQGRHSTSADTLAAIASALGVEPGALFPSALREASAMRRALDELVAFASSFGQAKVRYMLEVVRVVMTKRPTRKGRPLP